MIDEPLSELTYRVDLVAGQMDREIDAEVDRRRGR